MPKDPKLDLSTEQVILGVIVVLMILYALFSNDPRAIAV